jgi:hypothetical protein
MTVKRESISLYRWWRMLHHRGLTTVRRHGPNKHRLSWNIGIVIASVPVIPLAVSDISGLERGWLWHGWSFVAIPWFLGIIGFMLYRTLKVAARAFRDSRGGRR